MAGRRMGLSMVQTQQSYDPDSEQQQAVGRRRRSESESSYIMVAADFEVLHTGYLNISG